eukprot:9910340-Alexandrium_andersonii.AAC.1
MQTCLRRSKPELRGPRRRPQNWRPKLPRGAFCAVFRADSDSADEICDRRGSRSQHREATSSNPQSSKPQSAQAFALSAREPRNNCTARQGARNPACDRQPPGPLRAQIGCGPARRDAHLLVARWAHPHCPL